MNKENVNMLNRIIYTSSYDVNQKAQVLREISSGLYYE